MKHNTVTQIQYINAIQYMFVHIYQAGHKVYFTYMCGTSRNYMQLCFQAWVLKIAKLTSDIFYLACPYSLVKTRQTFSKNISKHTIHFINNTLHSNWQRTHLESYWAAFCSKDTSKCTLYIINTIKKTKCPIDR